MRDFHKLKVWEHPHDLTLKIYATTKQFQKEELYALTSQMRRAAASVPTNIAEGCGRERKAETIQFMNIAVGSACELEYQLILAHDLDYMDDPAFTALSSELGEVRHMIFALIRALQSDISQ